MKSFFILVGAVTLLVLIIVVQYDRSITDDCAAKGGVLINGVLGHICARIEVLK